MEWIRIEDEKPIEGKNYLICSVHGKLIRTVVALYINGEFLAYNYFSEDLEVAEEFTHWMPLPSPPNPH